MRTFTWWLARHLPVSDSGLWELVWGDPCPSRIPSEGGTQIWVRGRWEVLEGSEVCSVAGEVMRLGTGQTASVDPRPYRGGVQPPPPLRFFADRRRVFGYLMGQQTLRNFRQKKIDRVRSGHGAMTS